MGFFDKKLCRGGLLVAMGWFLASCATFDSRWQAAGVQTGTPKGLEGRWEGKWTSFNNDQSDDLRCVIVRINDHSCHAVFHATVNGAFYFDHTVELTVKPTAKGFSFHGQEDRPWYKGGTCYITGQSTGEQLHATYLDKVDHGTFDVARVK